MWLVASAVLAALLRRPRVFLLVLAAYAGSDLLSSGLKAAIGRPRPHLHPLIAVPHSGSFPSGHAATSFACAATLAWLVPRAAAPAFLLAAAIAYSRVYLGVHYPLDVLGGAALGLLVATALRWLSTAHRGSRRSPRAG